jgi:hypothetical protein
MTSNCLWIEFFFDNVHTYHGASCSWGELSMGRVVRGASVRGASCPWGEMSVGRDVHGARCHGARCRGAS